MQPLLAPGTPWRCAGCCRRTGCCLKHHPPQHCTLPCRSPPAHRGQQLPFYCLFLSALKPTRPHSCNRFHRLDLLETLGLIKSRPSLPTAEEQGSATAKALLGRATEPVVGERYPVWQPPPRSLRSAPMHGVPMGDSSQACHSGPCTHHPSKERRERRGDLLASLLLVTIEINK